MVFKKLFRIFHTFWLGFPVISYFICWLFGLEAKYFPEGHSRTVLKIEIFYIHIWLRGIFYSLSYTYTWMVKNAKFDFENFVIKPMRGRVSMCIWRMLQICFVVLKQLRVQSFHNWVYWHLTNILAFHLIILSVWKSFLFLGNFQFLEYLILKITERCDY